MCRRVLLALVSAAVLVGLLAQPGAAVNVPQAAVVSANPADWTPHVLDGKVDAIVQVGNKIVAGGLFTRVASAAAPATAIPRSNIFAFDAATGAIDSRFAPALDGQVESLAVAPDGLHVFAGGSFTKINGVAQKSLVKLRLRDGAGITAFKGRTSARVKDMAVSGGRLYMGGTFKTANGVARTALAAVDPVTGPYRATSSWPSPDPGRHRRRRQARRHPRRLQADRHRQLDLCGRPAARPDRHARPGHQPGDRHQLGDHALPAAVLRLVRHLHA